MIFTDEDQDFFYDAKSTHSHLLFGAISEVGSGVNIYESATEDSVYEDCECFIHKPKVKYSEKHLEKFLNDCLDESGFIRFENLHWIIRPLAHPEASEQQPQNCKNVKQPESEDNDELPPRTESKEQPRKDKGTFKKRLKKLFCCCSFCCGRKD